jgi:hypothetical protein
MTIWTCIRCGSPNGSITEMCFRCGAPKPAVSPPPQAPDEPSLVPLARYDVVPPSGPPATDQPAYPPAGDQPAYPPQAQVTPPFGPPVPYAPPPAGPPPTFDQPPMQPPAYEPFYEQPPHHPMPAEAAPTYAEPYSAPPAPARQRQWWVPVLVGVVVLLAIGAVTTVVLVGRDDNGGPTGSPPTTGAPTTAPGTGTGGPTSAPSTAEPGPASPSTPSSVGLVAIDPTVSDPRAADVAAMFDTHFAAVNAKDYVRALSVYDPAGVINPNDSRQASDYQRAISTTSDDQIMLRSVGPDTSGRGVLAARLTFRSSQQAGYGPRERPNETCTAWDVTYTLSQPGGTYKIFAGQATSAAC